MSTLTNVRDKAVDRHALERLADWLAVAVAVSLPLSTTATGVLVVAWLVAVLPTLEWAAVRRELFSAAGGLPVLLWLLAIVGMFWAEATWRERFGGLDAFHRLLVIPLLLAQFRRSENGMRVLAGFFVSAAAVLALSWTLVLLPAFPWRASDYGVPTKDYILQSEEFLMCGFVALAIALDQVRTERWLQVAGFVALAVLFFADIAFVATGRTTLLVAPVLVLLFGWRQSRWKGLMTAAVLFCVLGAALAAGSPYLRARLGTSLQEFEAYRKTDADSSTAFHLEFLRKSLLFVETAPILGHGTGSIVAEFRKAAVDQTGAAAMPTVNPHNQIFAVAIQLGLVGAAVVLAMWAAHFMLFRGAGLVAWIGTVIVADNFVSSLFNSHLFDFTQGWLYVFGVGVAGGMVLRQRDAGRAARPVDGHAADPVTV